MTGKALHVLVSLGTRGAYPPWDKGWFPSYKYLESVGLIAWDFKKQEYKITNKGKLYVLAATSISQEHL